MNVRAEKVRLRQGGHAGNGVGWCVRAALAGALLFTAGKDGVAAAQPDEKLRPTITVNEGDAGARPAAAGRVVKIFDFEEMDTNPAPVPRFWLRAQDDPGVGRTRPGFPRWNAAELDYATAARGKGSVRLPTHGGSTSLILDRGVLPVFANADYLVSALVKTEGLKYARAGLVARLLTRDGTVIEGSTQRSGLIAPPQWAQVSVEVLGEYEDAAFLQLELVLLQPADQESADGGIAGEFKVRAQDTKGGAWFDDVAVVQLPRVELLTSSALNLHTGGPPRIRLNVRDLTGEALAAELAVVDAGGKRIDATTIDLGAGRSRAEWTPRLPGLGWYRAQLELYHQPTGDGGEQERVRVGATYTDFAWMLGNDGPVDFGKTAAEAATAYATTRGSRDRASFGIVFDDLPPVLRDALPEIARALGAGRVTLPIWPADLSKAEVERNVEALRPTIAALVEDWRELTFTMPQVPLGLARESKLDPQDVWSLLEKPEELWRPYLDPYLDRFGQSVRRWQIGGAMTDRALWRGGLGQEILAAQKALGTLVPGPRVTVPTPLEHVPGLVRLSSGEIAVAAAVPVDGPIDAGATAAGAWRKRTSGLSRRPEFTAVLPTADPLRYGPELAVDEFIKRVVAYWAAATRALPASTDGRMTRDEGLCRLALHEPVRVVGRRKPTIMPRPEAAAWRNLVERLSDRRLACVLPTAPGLHAVVFGPAEGSPGNRPGLLVAWNETALPEQAVLRTTLGDGPLQRIDRWGNAAPLADPARVPLRVERGPVMVEGVDVELAMFLSQVEISPPFLSAGATEEENTIVLRNPWAGPISGTIAIVEPGGFESVDKQRDRSWKIAPRVLPFALAGGESTALPINVVFSPSEESGEKKFVLDIELQAVRNYGVVRVERPVELGLKDLALDLTASVGPGPSGPDVMLEAQVTNLSARTLDLELTAFPPGLPRTPVNIGEVLPGNLEIRRIPLPGAAANLRGKRIFVTLIDEEAGVRLNSSVIVP